jgi:hypothetical protein
VHIPLQSSTIDITPKLWLYAYNNFLHPTNLITSSKLDLKEEFFHDKNLPKAIERAYPVIQLMAFLGNEFAVEHVDSFLGGLVDEVYAPKGIKNKDLVYPDYHLMELCNEHPELEMTKEAIVDHIDYCLKKQKPWKANS